MPVNRVCWVNRMTHVAPCSCLLSIEVPLGCPTIRRGRSCVRRTVGVTVCDGSPPFGPPHRRVAAHRRFAEIEHVFVDSLGAIWARHLETTRAKLVECREAADSQARRYKRERRRKSLVLANCTVSWPAQCSGPWSNHAGRLIIKQPTWGRAGAATVRPFRALDQVSPEPSGERAPASGENGVVARAAWMASKRTSLSNGFGRYATAPDRVTRARVASSS